MSTWDHVTRLAGETGWDRQPDGTYRKAMQVVGAPLEERPLPALVTRTATDAVFPVLNQENELVPYEYDGTIARVVLLNPDGTPWQASAHDVQFLDPVTVGDRLHTFTDGRFETEDGRSLRVGLVGITPGSIVKPADWYEEDTPA